jgi:hypothetical protein
MQAKKPLEYSVQHIPEKAKREKIILNQKGH